MGLFVFISFVVLMNIFIAVVLEAVGYANSKRGIVPSDALDLFLQQWCRVDKEMTMFVEVSELLTILRRTPRPFGVAVSEGHSPLQEDEDYEGLVEGQETENKGLIVAASDRTVRIALRSAYANLKVSLVNGKVYFYDMCSEMLRVLAVQKARQRGESHGVFFQSRAAVSQLTSLETLIKAKLKRKWHLDLQYKYTLREGIAAVGVQKILRGHLHRNRVRKQQLSFLPLFRKRSELRIS